jgi:hypothetical protein
MIRLVVAFVIGFVLMGFVLVQQEIISKAWSTELALPKNYHAKTIVPLPPNYRAKDVIKVDPANHQPELCLLPGKEPFPGQTLQVDRRCKSGLRWVYEE